MVYQRILSPPSPPIKYHSTRSDDERLTFKEVVLRGLSPDKGLYIPERIPLISGDDIERLRDLNYMQLAAEIIALYVDTVGNEIPFETVRDISGKSFSTFATPEVVTPIVSVNNHKVMELFHGPTLAFKDVALQTLGNVFEFFLEGNRKLNYGQCRMTVMAATSGDTGSAAIAGLSGKGGIDCFVLYPSGRVSPIQEMQMTTSSHRHKNVHCLEVKNSTFDDCQDMVKASFNDVDFRDKMSLGAVNSINWCRVLAQITYYFYTYLRTTDSSPNTSVNFCVPTGNFGDILAGYYAKRMGLPIGDLVVATNENDIVSRFFNKGEYHREPIKDSISPSMDICVSSNFERYLFYLSGEDCNTVKKWMEDFDRTKKLTVKGGLLKKAKSDFKAAMVNTSETMEIIRSYMVDHGYMLCPHSAVGIGAIQKLDLVQPNTVCLATASHAKFPEACKKALENSGVSVPDPPDAIKELFSRQRSSELVANDVVAVRELMLRKVKEREAAEDYQFWGGVVFMVVGAIAGVYFAKGGV